MLFWLGPGPARRPRRCRRRLQRYAAWALALVTVGVERVRGSAGLSLAHRHAGRALSAGRRRRCAGARGGGEAVRLARPAGDRRQSRRRLRPRRHPRVHPQRARRLHAVPRPHRLDLDQSEPLCQCRFRSAQGFRADRTDRLDAGRAARASDRSPRRRSATWSTIAKKEGGKFNIGTSAVGTGGYLSAELFKSIAGVDRRDHSLQGHRAADERPARRPRAGRVRRAAAGDRQSRRPARCAASPCSSSRRFSLLPDVPTANESGLPGFESVLHYGLLAPAGTPRPIIDKLNAALRAAGRPWTTSRSASTTRAAIR